MSLEPGKKIELQIERLAHGGSGVGRYEGVVVFVPMTAPGDTVTAVVKESKKNFANADLVEVKTAGLSRQDAPCPYYGACGGCNWQHITYEEQLRQKEGMIRHLVSKTWPDVKIDPIVPNSNGWRYRRRVQVHSENGKTGFLSRGTHDIVDVADCLITREEVVSRFSAVRLVSERKRKKFEIVKQEDGEVRVIDLEREPYLFLQVNPEQNENMIRTLITRLEPLKPPILLDLYCGAGNFTIPLAQAFPDSRVFGVEANPASSEAGRKKAAAHPNAQIVTGDTVAFLKKMKFPPRDSAAVIDPPRAGAEPAALYRLKKLGLKKILYVSCHPATAKRDFQLLAPEFKLLRIGAFDMFPQTDHVELIAELDASPRLE